MNIKLSLGLPGEALSISVIRRILAEMLQTLGVAGACVEDLQVAVSEACTNALDHAGPGKGYETVMLVENNVCVVTVVDQGTGFEDGGPGEVHGPDDPEWAEAPPEVEHGHGIPLMRALVDDVVFDSSSDRGTAVSMRKELSWQDETPRVPVPAAGA